MPRTYKKKIGGRPYQNYTESTLYKALEVFLRGGKSIRAVSEQFGIPKSTLSDHIKSMRNQKERRKPGTPTVLTKEEEMFLCDGIETCATWGFPLTSYDLRVLVQNYLNKKGARTKFKENLPGIEWVKEFLKRNHQLTFRLSENVKRNRASITPEVMKTYFNELENSIQGIPNTHIINYDETNFTDDVGKKKVNLKSIMYSTCVPIYRSDGEEINYFQIFTLRLWYEEA